MYFTLFLCKFVTYIISPDGGRRRRTKSEMKITLNQREVELESGATLTTLLTIHDIKAEGIALAVNNRIIKRDEWQSRILSEGDKVTMIQATYGG